MGRMGGRREDHGMAPRGVVEGRLQGMATKVGPVRASSMLLDSMHPAGHALSLTRDTPFCFLFDGDARTQPYANHSRNDVGDF